MEPEILKIVGQVAGIGGIALGVFLLIFRDVVRKNIFPSLTKTHAYHVIRLVLILAFLVALAGIAAWLVSKRIPAPNVGGLPPDKQVIADILAHLTSTPKLHWNTPVLQDWSGDTERGEANRPYEITSQLADDNFKHYHRGAATYKLFGNDEWLFNRLFVSENSIRLLGGPPLSAEYLKKVVMDAGRQPDTPPFLWDTVWVYEIRIPEDPHLERISTNEFIFDAVIVCDQRSGSEIITEERRYTFRRFPVGVLIRTGLQTKKIHQRKINPGESVRLLRELPGRIDDAYGPR
jgi:hypothetical protein